MTPAAGAARRASMPARASAASVESWRGHRDVQVHLRSLQDRAAGIQADLSDLQRSMPYQFLFDGRELAGLTRSRLDAAMGAVEDLWQGYAVLSDMLTEADSILGRGAWGELALRNVEWLLFDDSLELAGRRLTPDELLDDLTHALSGCAQIVEDADDVWRRTVPALARCEDEIHSLLQRSSDLVARQPVDMLSQLSAQAAQLREQAGVDPLGVVEAFERDLLPRLEQARLRLTDELRQHRAVSGDLARARARLTELRDLHARVVEEAGSVWSKIAHPRGLMAPPDPAYLTDPPMGLAPWLTRLQALGRLGSYRQVRRGLASWMQTADEALNREREVLEANREPLGRRQELRGLLSSLEAKARAVGVARDAQLIDVVGHARAILYAPQTDLDQAALLVKGYGDRLRDLHHTNQKEVSYR
jgi:hypothetical protein